MTDPSITLTRLAGDPELPLLVVGPSLGTSAATLWPDCAAELGERFDVVGWDLPGHGANSTVPERPFDMAALARGVLAAIDAQRGATATFVHAGDSVGGAVSLQLALDAPERLSAVAVICAAAKFGEASLWSERIERVRAGGTAAMVEPSIPRWFSPGFLERNPARAQALLDGLRDTDDRGYIGVCGALGAFDARSRLGAIKTPVLAIAGADDIATPPRELEAIAAAVPDGRAVTLERVGHLAPAEAPVRTARLLGELG